MEATPPAMAGEEAAPATLVGATAGAPSVEPAAEEVAAETPVKVATAGATAVEVTGAGGRRLDKGDPSSGPQPAQGDEPKVVHGRLSVFYRLPTEGYAQGGKF
jgi:hypothetical protein